MEEITVEAPIFWIRTINGGIDVPLKSKKNPTTQPRPRMKVAPRAGGALCEPSDKLEAVDPTSWGEITLP